MAEPAAHLDPTPVEPCDDEAMVGPLEQDQLAAARRRPLPVARLSTRASVALWALRVFVLVVSAMVIYTFFSQLS